MRSLCSCVFLLCKKSFTFMWFSGEAGWMKGVILVKLYSEYCMQLKIKLM